MKMDDDPVSIEKVKKCESGLECIYESYKADKIKSLSAKCIAKSEIGNIS